MSLEAAAPTAAMLFAHTKAAVAAKPADSAITDAKSRFDPKAKDSNKSE
jgi:hypothetical protein